MSLDRMIIRSLIAESLPLVLAASFFVHGQQAKYPEKIPGNTLSKRVQKAKAQRVAEDIHLFMAVGQPDAMQASMTALLAQRLHQERSDLEFWGSQQHAQPAAAAQLVLGQHPFTIYALRAAGKELSVWHEQAYILDKALPLNRLWLDLVSDGTAMPDLRDPLDGKKRKKRADEIATYNVYCQAALYANDVPLDAFRKSALENKAVTFAHLWNEPAKYRGEVVYVKGRLKRLRKWDAPIPLQKRGIRSLYEGWVFGPTRGSHPYCVVFPVPAEDSSSPGGVLEPAEEMERWVEFYGYFIKKMRYRSGEGDKETPLLIGPTLIPIPAPTPPPTVDPPTISAQMLALFIGFGAFMAGLMLFLALWFRKGDRQFHSRLKDYHNNRIADMLEQSTPDEPIPGLEEKPSP